MICGLSLESDIFLDKANFDELTGIRNHRGFYADHSWRWAPAVDFCGISMILAEVDGFSDISYNYGSQAADDVLRFTAQTLCEYAGENGGVYRWSADSFMMILPGADESAASGTADAVSDSISENIFSRGEQTFSITVSYAVHEYDRSKSMGENIRYIENDLDAVNGDD